MPWISVVSDVIDSSGVSLGNGNVVRVKVGSGISASASSNGPFTDITIDVVPITSGHSIAWNGVAATDRGTLDFYGDVRLADNPASGSVEIHCESGSPAPSSNELVWTFSEGSSPFVSSGVSSSLYLTGVVRTCHGVYDRAVVLQSSQVKSAATSVGESTSFTLSFWYMPTRPSSGTVFAKLYAPNTWSAPYGVTVTSTGDSTNGDVLSAAIVTGGSATSITSAFNLVFGEWSHVALTYSQSSGLFRMYMNGCLAAAALKDLGTALDWGTHGEYWLGSNPTSSPLGYARIDDLRIEPVARCGADIRALMQRTRPASPTVPSDYPLLASTDCLWTFSERAAPYLNHGNASSSISLSVSGSGNVPVPGVFDSGISGPGGTNYLQSTQTTVGNVNSFTYCVWVMRATASGGGSQGQQYFTKTRISDSVYAAACIRQAASATDYLPSFLVNTAGGDRVLNATRPLQPFIWTHLAMTYDGTVLKGYVNGVLDVSTDYGGAAAYPQYDGTNGGRFVVLAPPQGGSSGSLMYADRPRFDSAVLTPEQILAIYRAGAASL